MHTVLEINRRCAQLTQGSRPSVHIIYLLNAHSLQRRKDLETAWQKVTESTWESVDCSLLTRVLRHRFLAIVSMAFRTHKKCSSPGFHA